MPRLASIWKRQPDGWFYTTFRGQKIKLSQDKEEARRAFHALHAQVPKPEPEGLRPTFRRLADEYLDFTQRTKSERTYDHQRYFLQSFCDHVRRKIATELRSVDVTEWLLKHKEQWGHNTQVTARGLVAACLNWAVEQGYLPYTSMPHFHRG